MIESADSTAPLESHVGTPRLSDLAEAPTIATRDLVAAKKPRSLWGNAWRQFRRHRLAMAGSVILIIFFLGTFVGTAIYPREIDEIDFSIADMPPSFDRPFYPMGTDSLGQDLFARILWGGRISLLVGVLAALMAITLGTTIGAIAGFFGGVSDSILMRITDMFISLPQLPLLLLITSLYAGQAGDYFDGRFEGFADAMDIESRNFGTFFMIVGVIALLSWTQTARLVRAQVLSTKEKDFVEAARAIGARQNALILRHILPNVLSPIIVAATLTVGGAIIFESSLSFLGLGFPPDVPTWGTMLFEATPRIQIAPYQAFFPGMMIFLTVLSINYVGDGLRDALDPRKTH